MIKKIKASLTAKIFLITSALLLLACVLTYSFIAWLMPITYTSELSGELDERAHWLAHELGHTTLEDCGELLERFIMESKANIVVFDSEGNYVELPVYHTISSVYEGFVIEVAKVETIANGQADSTHTVADDMSTTKEYSFTFSGSPVPYTMLVSGGMREVNQAEEALKHIFPWLIVTVLCISLLGSLFYSRYITRPIVEISGISQKMSNLEFDWYCADSRSDEIGLLAHSLNELSRRLSTALGELRRANAVLKDDIARERELEHKRMEFFSAVSHEMKTPITIIKGQLEGMLRQVGAYKDRDKYLARALAVTGTMEKMVQEILDISRMETAGFSLHKKDLDFSELVRKQIAEHSELLAQKGIMLYAEIADGMSVHGDRALLQKVIRNLISNATNYSPSGGAIYIKVHSKESGVLFTVENTGSHIAEDMMPQVFEAFYRVEQSRNRQSGGSGLGLYIVKMVLEQHGADYKIENTAAGVQFTFTLK